MGIGYTTIMYDEGSFEEGLQEIAACRYDGLEMSLGEVNAYGANYVGEKLDEHDLDLYMLMGGWLESEDEAKTIAEGAYTAADLGAEFIGMLPPQRGLVEDDSVEKWITRVCDAAADAGITPVLHHHSATHIERPEETESWLARCPDNLGLLWDTAHQYPYSEHYPEGDVTDGIERFADSIEYVHLKDVEPTPGYKDHIEALTSGNFNLANVALLYYSYTDLGEGRIDFAGVADALDAIGYDGHITIEMEKQTMDTLVHAKQNIDYWRRASDSR
ncbi:sugar phosphate isomerase/epimerase [Natronococcus sp. A-GB1]|uniref:sugar phosphate isomerase/epimerase family protein n=1 Tax=Natronococcus sp. A-GB1 TaxID=3037648 RepID=UPI00241EE6E8|nr:sugar phosphate isomerase/epimerase [Natronococcus sp. A-GB1]MDG5761666.1 sugar phosphate isomerase/epimerase [Natronococcus sp. A-GB1]